MRFIAFILCLLPAPLSANDWDAFNNPGVVAIMRHALAPGTGDPANFDITDCRTQRNLDDKGRAQSKAIGEALRDRGIVFEAVYASQWCRTRDTAELMDVGTVEDAPYLNSFFSDRSTSAAQTAEAFRVVSAADFPLMMVTHQVNISALTGRFTSSGEILIINIEDDKINVLGSVLIDP